MSERYEQLLAFLGSQLPVPVRQHTEDDGDVRFVGGDPAEVVVVLTESSVVVSEFAGVWQTPFTFAEKPKPIGLLKWRRMPENALWTALSALIKGARDARLSRFQVCRYCERNTAPEYLHEADVCQSCAAEPSGAIH
jgi:hypothetical protein